MITQAELKAIKSIGYQMSNVCFNLSQLPEQPLSKRNAEVMRELYKQWDALTWGKSKPKKAVTPLPPPPTTRKEKP